jgi:hypothetical protein
MIPQIQQDVLGKLAALCSLSPGVRIGQLLSHLGFLAEDVFDRALWEIDDEQLLRVIERHRVELSSRQSYVA